MAILNFKGKTFVQNFHLTVPYCQLVPKKDKSITDKVSLNDNLIIHGDNLKALKALLPNYGGKVKCIYIDPPYNTGNENWVYNDNVNSPMMQEWLGKVVDREDLTRRDKWLCMMMPRLKLLKELLSEDGVLFISIDDNEFASLKMILDEIFNENSIATITVENDSRSRQYDSIAVTHEYIIACSKTANFSYNQLIDEKKQFQYTDKDGGFDIYELRNRNIAFNIENRPNLYYPFWVNPNDQDKNGFYQISLEEKRGWIKTYPQESQGIKTVWRWSKETASKYLNKILFARKHSDGFFQIIKKYRGATFSYNSVWTDKLIKTDKGTLEIKSLFGNKKVFDYPKPVELIKRLLKIFSNPGSIILDSFAGSGTSAHAVLDLNKEDDGSRKFILIECEDYADKITAERVRRVINGVKDSKDEKLRKGLGGTFSYFELGDPIEMETILEGRKLPSYIDLARYVFYTATGEEFDSKKVNEKKNFIGESREYDVYLFYQPNIEYLKTTALTLERAKALGPYKKKKRMVFAPSKYLDTEYLLEYRIEYCQLPFEIYKLKE